MVVLFGALFNDIYINRDDQNGNHIQTMKVPLSYGPKEKFIARLVGDPDLQKQFAMVLPRLAFEMISLDYDPDRKFQTTNKLTSHLSNGKANYVYNPVPYNFQFSLYVMVKNAVDGTRIIEQILPFFTPSWTGTVNLVPEMNISKDIPIILNSVNCVDTYEGGFGQRREIVWTLNFTLQGYLFGPVTTSNVIKKMYINFYTPTGDIDTAIGNTDKSLEITIEPGLTANGQPTSNAQLSIPLSQITANSNYGFIVDYINYDPS
jgi:hypothetical protein